MKKEEEMKAQKQGWGFTLQFTFDQSVTFWKEEGEGQHSADTYYNELFLKCVTLGSSALLDLLNSTVCADSSDGK